MTPRVNKCGRCRLLLISEDRESYLHLEGVPGDEMPTVDVVACVDGEVVRNESVMLLGIGKFVRELATFAASRRGGVALSGTDDFRRLLLLDAA